MEIETHKGQIEQGSYQGVAGCCLLGYIEDLIYYLVHCKFDNIIWIKLVDLPLWWKRFSPRRDRGRLLLSKEEGYSARSRLKTAWVWLPSLGIRVKSLHGLWGCNPQLMSVKGNISCDCNRQWVRPLTSKRQNYFISVIPFKYVYFSNSA